MDGLDHIALHHRHRQTSHTPKLKHHREGQLEGRQSVHIPLPLDHFFFCFFPPVAAGAILTDLLVLRWRVVVEMWVDGR